MSNYLPKSERGLMRLCPRDGVEYGSRIEPVNGILLINQGLGGALRDGGPEIVAIDGI